MRVLAPVAIASVALLLLGHSAQAAAVRGAILACRDQADIKRAFRQTSDKDAKENVAYLKSRLGAGDCVQLLRDQKVLVDQRDGPLWCVRPSGALDCYWTHEKAIDLYPPPPAEPGEQAGAKKKR